MPATRRSPSPDVDSAAIETPNSAAIACWNEVLTPKWIRFRHLLSGNGQIHSDIAYPRLDVRRGQRVLDVACGFGETTLELADRVGPLGSVLGIDCTDEFIEIAEYERSVAGVRNVDYRVADIERIELAPASFDHAVSRFGLMFCANPVRALRAIGRALVPGGELAFITWRTIGENPCWRIAEQLVLRELPPPGEAAQSCGPGPFSMSGLDTNRLMLQAAGFDVLSIEPIDAELCIGRTLEEAVEYQLAVGPSGYVIREAGAAGARALGTIRARLARAFQTYQRQDGSVWMGSGTWFVRARKPQVR